MRARTSSVVVRWKAALCRFYLWPVMDLQKWERCKSSSHTKKSSNGLKTYSCKDLQAILKNFKVNFVVVVVVVVDDDVT